MYTKSCCLCETPTDGLQLWPHYDVVDNLLMQIRGTKRVILWPPSEEGNLYTQVRVAGVSSME